MKKLGKWLFVLSLFVTCAVVAWFLAPLLDVNFKIAMLIAMIIGYVLISAYLELFRYRLRKRVEQMSDEERAALSEFDTEIRYSIPAHGSPSPRITTPSRRANRFF